MGSGQNLYLAQPPLEYPDVSGIDYQVANFQGFNWYPNCVFFFFRYGNGWLTVFRSDQVKVSKESTRAIVVPFEVPSEGHLNYGGDMSGVERFKISPGQYRLLFEMRELTLDEVLITEKYNYQFDYSSDTTFLGDIPELCTLTFVPTQEKVKPEFLKFSSWHASYRGDRSVLASPEEIVMFEYPAEEAY